MNYQSILEFEGDQKIISISKKAKKLSDFLNNPKNQDFNFDTDQEQEYLEKYYELQEYYNKKAERIFGFEGIMMEAFFIQTEEMKKKKIIDYCKFDCLLYNVKTYQK